MKQSKNDLDTAHDKFKQFYKCWIRKELLSYLACWLCLIALRAAGLVGYSWPLVLSGCVWIPIYMYALTFPVVSIFMCCTKLKAWYQHKKDIREILNTQAEIVGLKRKPGETNKRLRARIVWEITEPKLDQTPAYMEGGADNACIHRP